MELLTKVMMDEYDLRIAGFYLGLMDHLRFMPFYKQNNFCRKTYLLIVIAGAKKERSFDIIDS